MTLTQPLISKRCCTCKEELPVTLFSKNRSNKDGLNAQCLECKRAASKAYYRSTKGRETNKNAQLKKTYGITKEEYDNLLLLQGGKCAICGTDSCRTGAAFAVDHCHDTGKIRGLLCRPCNSAIGFLNDNASIARAAADYLEAS